MTLKPSQMKFVNEYFRCNLNATKAYMATHPKASYETARREGSTNLSNPDVSAEITRRLKEQQMSGDEVLKRLSEQASGEYAAYIQPDGWVDLAGIVRDGKGHLIKSVEKRVRKFRGDVEEEQTTVTFYDGQKALALIGKHRELFVDRVDHTTKGESLNVAMLRPSEIAERLKAMMAATDDNKGDS